MAPKKADKKSTFTTQNPLVWVALAFMLGLAFARSIPLEIALSVTTIGLLGLVVAVFGRSVIVSWIACIIGFIGLGAVAFNLTTLQKRPTLSYLIDKNRQAVFVGEVGIGQFTPGNKYATSLHVKAVLHNQVWARVDGKVNLRLNINQVPSPGSTLMVEGFYVPNHVDEGDPLWASYRQYLARQNIAGSLYATGKHASCKVLVEAPQWNLLEASAQTARRLTQIIDETLGENPKGAVAKALLIGTREGLTPEIQKNYQAGGAIHLLVVSGGHLGILWGIFFWILQRLPTQWQGRGRWFSRLLIVVLLWGFAFITGLGPSIVRAAVMVTILQIGVGIGRPSSGLNALAGACIVMLAFEPLAFFSLGFQLSVACVAGLIVLTPRIEGLFKPKYQAIGHLWTALCATLSAQAGALPIILVHFGQVPIWFWVANPPAIIGSSLLLVGFLILFCLYPVSLVLKLPFVLNTVGQSLRWCVGILNSWMETIAQLPWAVQEGWFLSPWQAIVLSIGLLWIATVPKGIGLLYARAALLICFAWCVASIVDLRERSKTTRLAIGYDTTQQSYYIVHQNGLILKTSVLPNKNTKALATLWRAEKTTNMSAKNYKYPALLAHTTLLVANKTILPTHIRRLSKQKGWTIYDMKHQTYYELVAICNPTPALL